MTGIKLADLLPQLTLDKNETLLMNTGLDATSVLDGQGGFMRFRQWECRRGDESGMPRWYLASEFVLGSNARGALGDLLQRVWSGCVLSEAATVFKNGDSCVELEEAVDLATAKAWVMEQVSRLLKDEDQISQALVLGPNGAALELMPNTWGSDSPEWIDVTAEVSAEAEG
jgi:hypothetical protein